MPIDYSKAFDLMKERGLTTYRIRKDKIISEGALQSLRYGKSVTMDTIEKLCAALGCQPGDLMKYVSDEQKDGAALEVN
ncbi:helix-turn-helix transcriptional regulator [Hydrogenoanaerobacterium sp.]|uniref:helix-turn-helix domain-containing protein n=1 Tax=Hydrogenoanaerobacterium sp. TaxID=2953763 RepID=UPI00289A3F18|nr:helix-turn-helix transcriptional regulator [Hydrogenoanaerobacterium sp.]